MNAQKSNSISALIITYNEEFNISELIENLSFTDEIIVIDSYSTDNTVAIIKSFPDVTLIQNKFKDYTSQRNLALSYAKNDWILFVDADERITTDLKNEILETVHSKDTKDAYYFYRKFMFQNEPLHFSGWQTDKNLRLFKRGKAIYNTDKLVHEKLILFGSVGIFKNKLIHYSYNEYSTYKDKMIHYGKFKAKELFLKKKKINFFHRYVKPLYKFLYDYVVRLGVLDGKKGIIICYLNALSIYWRYKELDNLKGMTKTSLKSYVNID